MINAMQLMLFVIGVGVTCRIPLALQVEVGVLLELHVEHHLYYIANVSDCFVSDNLHRSIFLSVQNRLLNSIFTII